MSSTRKEMPRGAPGFVGRPPSRRVARELHPLRRLDHLEDHLRHPEERLAHRAAGCVSLAQAAEVEPSGSQRRHGSVEVGLITTT